ncbi:hypothetical protein CC1G_14180 [Coprinopsis cinerea okayama7|uniref:Uncharacterized protein n=1 Tax=Coprinopsis cinerea (strain Okayama-7 / 130 / ATCC MYA-4618 / FGSC 9003) TaxID=240176 RepID=D6RLC6_COPC7|nr:hypothetical protein CC1G_14180 [Coprinopsis cinerea okayama7\|eukprot:XP_002911647.1 hypothetical protein CC1G_14180 [Coprinopsis cinerea okayama7\
MRNSTTTRTWGSLNRIRSKPSIPSPLGPSSSRCRRLQVDATKNGNSNGPQEPLTLWHKTSSVVKKTFESQGIASGSLLSVDALERVLSRAYDDLSNGAQRPVKLLVHAVDQWSGAEDFVTALVADPLGSEEHWKAVQQRWNGNGNELTIAPSSQLSTQGSTLSLPSTYLQRFPVPIEITEIRHTSSPSILIDAATLSRLYEADVPILLCNPLTTPLNKLLSIPLPQGTIIVVRAPPSQPIDANQLLSSVPSFAPKPTIILADPTRAVNAVDLMQSNPASSSSVVQRFQDEFTGSNVSAFTQVLQKILHAPEVKASPKQKQTTASDYLRVKFAMHKLEDALSSCIASIENLKARLDAACVDASRLRDKVEETGAKVEYQVLGPSDQTNLGRNARGNEVTEALRQAEKQMQAVMSRFTWWKMVWRVDEVTNLVASALQRTWCPELERKASTSFYSKTPIYIE